MKQTYVAPTTEILELEMEPLMLDMSASGSLPGTDTGEPGSGTGKDADAQGRRGTWGNLWE